MTIRKPIRVEWLQRYIKQLKSAEGLSAVELFEAENKRRATEELPQIKLQSVQRILNMCGYSKFGTAPGGAMDSKVREIGTIIGGMRTQMQKLEALIKQVELPTTEREFCYLYLENYSSEGIVALLGIDNEKVKELMRKFGVG